MRQIKIKNFQASVSSTTTLQKILQPADKNFILRFKRNFWELPSFFFPVLSTVSWGMRTSTWVTMCGPCSTINMTSPSPEPWETGQFSPCTLGIVPLVQPFHLGNHVRPCSIINMTSPSPEPWETGQFLP